ncbi:hypothetical protein FHP05_08320 [Cerasibacillus terrae]|uniref:Uncharacterized protein n=1 Tax=Cerasibacillus terrae TaxID=2498845 RepID=A0A5C8NVT9_9BACI|nr:hypothetical protein [Cerasibacillus terrae]TXL65130.1 hypothetical protein FHP05_08320 [Cerasibacillus terrae]
MVQSVVIIGAVMTIIMVLLGVGLLKASSKATFLPYYPGVVIFATGVVMATLPAIIGNGKIVIMGAGIGGWGIAFMFAAAIGLILTSIVDAYKSEAVA